MRGTIAISRRTILRYVAWVLWCVIFAEGYGSPPLEQARGLPFIRSYPLDEIGNVPRGLRLGFDEFGRIAAMYDGLYTVLNDSAWVDRIGPPSAMEMRMTTIKVANGHYYYGGRGAWGMVEVTADGRFKPASLVPADAPEWTTVTPFNNLVATSTGVYFYEFNGVVYWDFARQRNFFYQMPRLARLFTVGERAFVSSEDQRIREILPESGESRLATSTGLEGQVVTFAAPLDASHTLLALRSGALMSFDGNTAQQWPADPNLRIEGRITAMERLVEGGGPLPSPAKAFGCAHRTARCAGRSLSRRLKTSSRWPLASQASCGSLAETPSTASSTTRRRQALASRSGQARSGRRLPVGTIRRSCAPEARSTW